MSTPKVNFFIKKIAGDLHRAVPGSGPVNEQLFGLAHRGHSSAGEQEMLPGETSRKAPVCPDASPLLCPDPEQLFPIPMFFSSDPDVPMV